MCRGRESGLRLKAGEPVSSAWQKSANGIVGATRTEGLNARIKVAAKAIDKLKGTIRQLTRRTRGHRLVDIVQELKTALTGWKAYFGIAEVMSPLREIDKWVRRRLRCYAWKQWGSAGYRELRKRGGHCARGLEHKQECTWSVAPEQNASLESGFAAEVVSSNGAARIGTSQGSMRSLMLQGTTGYVTRMSGGVGGGGREAFSYPDYAAKNTFHAAPRL